MLGRMYMFYYDPKHKKTLKTYDRFPLIFPIKKESDGFIGMNFHYLGSVSYTHLTLPTILLV